MRYHARIAPRFDSWRAVARALLSHRVAPEWVVWDDGSGSAPLTVVVQPLPADAKTPVALPKRFVALAEVVADHSAPERWDVLYRVAFRIHSGERSLLEVAIDDDVAALVEMDRQVKRDVHKMHAFVRFRSVPERDNHYVAWYRPDHHILHRAAPFFAERFRSMIWTIHTPGGSASWDGQALTFSRGAARDAVTPADDADPLWRTYYRSIFNPARTNTRAMRAEMPARFWAGLPETREIPEMLLEAGSRTNAMIGTAGRSAGAFLPEDRSLAALAAAATACEGCDLFAAATQTVFGRGEPGRIMLVGEQPGDREDREGVPFVGPAGEVLASAMADAGLDRGAVYMTNAVKHFGFTERGKQRIHRTPRMIEVTACRPWLEAEIAAVKPPLIVALGATAAKSLLGATVKLEAVRGSVVEGRGGVPVLPTWHPAAVLRMAEGGTVREQLIADLRLAAELVAQRSDRQNDRTPSAPLESRDAPAADRQRS